MVIAMHYAAIWMLSLALAAADPPVVSLLTQRGEQLSDCIYDGAAPTWVDGGNLIVLAENDVVAINALSGHRLFMSRVPGASDASAGRVTHVLGDDTAASAHNTVILLDERTVITSSGNVTKSAHKEIAENLPILDSPGLAKSHRANGDKRQAVSRPFVRKMNHVDSGDT